MADTQGGLEFVQGSVGTLANLGGELDGVELAPTAPSGLGGECAGFRGGQVTIDAALAHRKPAGGFGSGAAALDKLHHPFTQIQRVSFHPHSLEPILPMSM